MSDDKIYLNREEQQFLMQMFDLPNPMDAVDAFAEMLVKEGADPGKLENYVKKILTVWKKKNVKL